MVHHDHMFSRFFEYLFRPEVSRPQQVDSRNPFQQRMLDSLQEKRPFWVRLAKVMFWVLVAAALTVMLAAL